jgi:glycine cleavage system H lipoate-binding protein
MAEKTKRFNMYSDPGHAWVKVKRDTLDQLGVTDKISHLLR